ncbi:MAG: mechanosensitive ion channel [Cyanobacteria bacterium SZAS-4]|nr:mechanosensitive ion channel [Cyanobacteria bacterium SZAS-4]
MDIHNFFEQSVSFIVFLATSSEYAVSFWATVLCLILLLNKKAVVEYIWRSLHLIEDLVLQKEYFAKIDKALKILLITLACSPFFHFLPPIVNKALSAFALFVVPFAALYIVVQALDLVFFGWYLTKYKDANVPSVMRAFVIGGIYIVFGLIFLEWSLGVNVLPLLATSTVVTAVLGLAMQDTLKNLFAGLTMSFEKRYRQGDWVNFRLDANNSTVGQVSEIGWRTTRIKTLDNNFAVIPNSMFTTYQVVNYSLPTPSYARSIEFPIKSSADVATVLKSLVKNAPAVDGVLKEPAPEALLLSVKPDHLVVRLRFYIEDFSKGDTLSGRVMEVCLADLAKMSAIPAIAAAAAGKE